MATVTGWDWLVGILPYLIVGLIVVTIVGGILRYLGPILGLFPRRRRPLVQERDDYDMLFTNDMKLAGKSNALPCRELYVKDPDDWEQTSAYWGKIIGGVAGTDVVILVVRKPWKIFTRVLYVPRSKVSNMNTKQLTVFCVGFTLINRLYWIPEWGSRIGEQEREDLVDQIRHAIDARYNLFGESVVREERLAMAVKGMEPELISGRSIATEAPRVVTTEHYEGVEGEE